MRVKSCLAAGGGERYISVPNILPIIYGVMPQVWWSIQMPVYCRTMYNSFSLARSHKESMN